MVENRSVQSLQTNELRIMLCSLLQRHARGAFVIWLNGKRNVAFNRRRQLRFGSAERGEELKDSTVPVGVRSVTTGPWLPSDQRIHVLNVQLGDGQ